MSHKARVIDPLSLEVPEAFRTARLRFRKACPTLARDLAEVRTESHASLLPWFHGDMGTLSDETDESWQRNRLSKQASDFDRRASLNYYIFDGETLIGLIELTPIWRRGQIKLSYWFRSASQRQGYGTEAVAAAIVFAFRALNARLVTTGHAEPNIGSAKLARKLGFVQVARQPLACELPDGTLVAGIGYALEDCEHLTSVDVSWKRAGAPPMPKSPVAP